MVCRHVFRFARIGSQIVQLRAGAVCIDEELPLAIAYGQVWRAVAGAFGVAEEFFITAIFPEDGPHALWLRPGGLAARALARFDWAAVEKWRQRVEPASGVVTAANTSSGDRRGANKPM